MVIRPLPLLANAELSSQVTLPSQLGSDDTLGSPNSPDSGPHGLSQVPLLGWQIDPVGAGVSLPENQLSLPPQISFADPHTSPNHSDSSCIQNECVPSNSSAASGHQARFCAAACYVLASFLWLE
ncbi:hypothetical protein Nepgr_007880 [Nepenthes gracilis]|uniref:Uncharacterized protein n=1 Tax=Nepenthes gracilis TaxID=150966 RepID=A0AAD3S7P3_NEPGR|nr:hypothetical protein Nepgr_007880 [Nepenthes gracilis]